MPPVSKSTTPAPNAGGTADKTKDSPASDCTTVMTVAEIRRTNEKFWEGKTNGDL